MPRQLLDSFNAHLCCAGPLRWQLLATRILYHRQETYRRGTLRGLIISEVMCSGVTLSAFTDALTSNSRAFIELKGLTGFSHWQDIETFLIVRLVSVVQYLRYGDARIAVAEGSAVASAPTRVPVYRTAVVDQVYPERSLLVARYTDGVSTQLQSALLLACCYKDTAHTATKILLLQSIVPWPATPVNSGSYGVCR